MTDLHDEQIRQLVHELGQAAPLAPPLPAAPDAGAKQRSPRNIRPKRRAIAALTVVLVIGVAIAAGIVLTRSPRIVRDLRTVSQPTTTAPHPTGSSNSTASAADLAHGKWVEMAPPPSAVGFQTSSVWTGSHLIIWGGSRGENEAVPVATGASYDPTTNRWTVLPPAPISGRREPAVAWTGKELVVWGGSDNSTGAAPHAADDGAAYDPTTNTWRRLPISPIPASLGATALWTQGEVVILGGSPVGVERGVLRTVAAYEPVANRWRKLPELPTQAGHNLVGVDAVTVRSRIVVFERWTHINELGGGRTSEASGTDLYELDLRNGTWQKLPSGAGTPGFGFLDPVSTGSTVIGIGNPQCPECRGPFVFPSPSAVYDPMTGVSHLMKPGPVDVESSLAVWTGAALVRFNPTVAIGETPPGSVGSSATTTATLSPGDAAAWDPHTDSWTNLPPAPGGATDATLVWTGHELLVWGDLFESKTSKRVGYRYTPTS